MKKQLLALLCGTMITGFAHAVTIKKINDEEANAASTSQTVALQELTIDEQIAAAQEKREALKAEQEKRAFLATLMAENEALEAELAQNPPSHVDNSAQINSIFKEAAQEKAEEKVKVVQKQSIFESIQQWTAEDFASKRYGSNFSSLDDVWSFFNCAPLTVTNDTKRSIIDQISGAVNTPQRWTNFNDMHNDRFIDAILVITERTDLRRGTARLAFDALLLNDQANRLFTLNEMGWMGYNLQDFLNNYESKSEKRRHPAKWSQFNSNGNACTNFGTQQTIYNVEDELKKDFKDAVRAVGTFAQGFRL